MKNKILTVAPAINFVLSAILVLIELITGNYSASAAWLCSALGWALIADRGLDKENDK